MAAAASGLRDQWRAGRGERLVFLIGAPRSGTTWLQLLLAQSPAIATVNETHLFSSYLRSCFAAWRDFQTNPRPIGLHRVIDEATLIAGLKHLTDEIFSKVAATRPGARWVLEKTPDHAFRGREILRLYPRASFIHLIRDPRDAVASEVASATSWGRGWASPGPFAGAGRWLRIVQEARRLRELTPHYLEVRYEALLANGPNVLGQLFGFLGLRLEPDEAARWIARCRPETLSHHPELVRPWDLALEPEGFFGGTSNRHRRRRHDRIVEAVSGSLMDELGYPRHYGTADLRLVGVLDRWSRALERHLSAWRRRL